jgi:hypothetical protein
MRWSVHHSKPTISSHSDISQSALTRSDYLMLGGLLTLFARLTFTHASVHNGRTSNDVNESPENRKKENQDGPAQLGPTVVIFSCKVVNEAPDDEPDHQDDASEDEHRPEQTQQRERVSKHSFSFSAVRSGIDRDNRAISH